MVAVSVVTRYVISVTGPGSGVDCCSYLDSLVLYLLKIHVFNLVAVGVRCVTLSHTICSVPDVDIARVLQVQCWYVGRLRCFGHRRTPYLLRYLEIRCLVWS